MKKIIKRLIAKTPIFFPLRNWVNKINGKKQLKAWMNSDKNNLPPHIVKQINLKSYAESFGLKVLVETGTYYGDMVEAMKHYFEKIYSIELGPELFDLCTKRFKADAHIQIIHGDSGTVLKDVVKNIHQPALFWLDGHYSAGETAKGKKITPIYEELSVILDNNQLPHVILIDDARLFGTDPGYPIMRAVKEFILSKRENLDISIRNDCICVIPK